MQAQPALARSFEKVLTKVPCTCETEVTAQGDDGGGTASEVCCTARFRVLFVLLFKARALDGSDGVVGVC